MNQITQYNQAKKVITAICFAINSALVIAVAYMVADIYLF